MAKLNLHKTPGSDDVVERGKRFLELSGAERLLHLIRLNRYAMLMKGGPLKQPQRKGLVIERKK